MAAGNWTLFNKAHKKLLNGTFGGGSGVASKTFRCRIYKAQVSASLAAASNYSLITELGTSNQAANMSDYTLSALVLTALNGSATMKLDGTNLVISASGGDATSLKYAVVYSSLSAGDTGHLLMWCQLSASPFTVTDTNTLTIYAPTNGYFVVY